ncbi:MBL fold metallo-hydrolase [uncultured Vibrio sp.]|uniref:MBL fold metallo-hydrolase n=1 Tax=uncultured Vibrio sp. TaxID=114054 RepID=UPI0025CC9554|nr:MBL fold metallo-hydrolase [uncultured Vibrio sp.]
MTTKTTMISLLMTLGIIVSPFASLMAQAKTLEPSDTTQVVMLGTGTPFNDANHSGQSVAIVVNDSVYLVDFGPGVARQIDAARLKGYKGFPGNTLRPTFIKHAFLTHLDSDHTMGIADIVLTPWVLGRKEPINIYGPPNTNFLVNQTLKAFDTEIQHRMKGAQPANPEGYKVNTTIIREPGVVYEDENVTVEAFNARHGDWPDGYALGYRFTTPDRVIVVSGDTAFDEKVVENYKGADILIHEVYSMEGLAKRTPDWQNYHQKAHTSTEELAKIGEQVSPALMVLNHVLYFGTNDESVDKEFSQFYRKNYTLAKDLDVY